ncbi:hypothetical protein CEXT_54921 [Caerostris extrusa]|uniref:Uncharacterized protein n=1 Tax=Caerostris extrusa TaxID=172846 RepID=A0AAV4VVH6_CAEEX|nr:hypothetical protein CEXT_54921 [Caerostris extrusa]
MNESERMEYSLLICSKVPVSYLMDLYCLYRGINSPPMGPFYVKTVTVLCVEKVVDPEEWLYCIKWSKYQSQCEHSSLELFISRRNRSLFYYAVGDVGNLLVSRENNHTIQIHSETVQMLTGITGEYCHKPAIYVVDVHPRNVDC